MLTLMNTAFEPSLLYPDKITFLTSVNYYESLRSDSSITIVEKIKDLITTKNTRLQGLQFLEIALQQNPDIYLKGRWTVVLFDIIKDSVCYILKEHICKILCKLLTYLGKDPVANAGELHKFTSVLFPYLLSQIEENVEWVESAALCLCACLKSLPQALESQKDRLLKVILKQMSYSVSSRTIEVFAECFSLIPCCLRQNDPNVYIKNWTNQYVMTLNSMHHVINRILAVITEDSDPGVSIPDVQVFTFGEEDEENEIYATYMRRVRRFINLSKCLAKMLSTPTKFSVEVPIKVTLECIVRLFQVHDICKVKLSTMELQIVVSSLPQMQIASLVAVESLVLNFNLVPFTFLISQLITNALRATDMPNLSSEPVRPLRQAVWKLLDMWVNVNGPKVSSEVVSNKSLVIEGLLKDIIIKDSVSQPNSVTSSQKSKKGIASNTGHNNTFLDKSHQATCKAALKALDSVLYTGAAYISKNLLQDIFTKIVSIAYAISTSDYFPFPYDDDACRKLLYSVLLTITVISNPDHCEPIQCATGIFKNAMNDPSIKVVKLCHKANAYFKLHLHPKRPVPVFKNSDEKQARSLNAMVSYPEWSSDDYVQNLPSVESVSENLTPRIAQTFHNSNEGKMASDEYMQVDACYSEQTSESQFNGQDMLEIEISTQCQDDVDSEDEEDEEDDERSYGEEENQEVEMQSEHLYIPSTSKMQVLDPVHITSETEQSVDEQEYEELKPCEKNEDTNKNLHLNGVQNTLVPEEGMSSMSAQNVANENGIYGFEDEDIEDEEDEEEDEEEENVVYPAEKKVPEYFEPPSKKLKGEDEVKEELDEEREGSRSPTLGEMKADFCYNEIDDVKS